MGDGMLSLSWNNHKTTFCHILANLREKDRYTDVTLACEGKFYRVHKLVLSTCSEYFEVMFENTPCKHPVIVLNNIKHDEIEALLSYMYAGVVNVAQSDLSRLIKAAELLKIKGLAVPDEPPQESEPKKSRASTWSSREDRTSPSPKRRRKDDSATPYGGSQTSNSPASSPRASPFTETHDQSEKSSRTFSDVHSSDKRTENSDIRTDKSDPLSNRLEDNSEKLSNIRASEESSAVHNVDETLVKEEILEPPDDSDDRLDSGMDYGDRLDGDASNSSGQMLPNKFDHSSLSQNQEPVVEALAGPSGMQGWLGDMGGGFPSVEGFRGEGSQQELRQSLPGQQPHQMAVAVKEVLHRAMVNNLVQLAQLRGSSAAAALKDTAVSLGGNLVVGTSALKDKVSYIPSSQQQDKDIPSSPDPSPSDPLALSPTPPPATSTSDGRVGSHQFEESESVEFEGSEIDEMEFLKYKGGRKPGAYGNYKKKVEGLLTRRPLVKKYDCLYCDYVTITSTNLMNHMRTHTGEKPFACDYCPYRSAQKGNLRTHVVKHHADKEPGLKIAEVRSMAYPWHNLTL